MIDPWYLTGIMLLVLAATLAAGRVTDWRFRRLVRQKLGDDHTWGRCHGCREENVLRLVEKTGYEGWFCADCQDPPLECTCYEAAPGHMVGCPAKKR